MWKSNLYPLGDIRRFSCDHSQPGTAAESSVERQIYKFRSFPQDKLMMNWKEQSFC